MSSSVRVDRPLAGLVIVDAVRGPLAPITRYLAELGAVVHRVGAGGPTTDPVDLAANAGKRWLKQPIDDAAVRAAIAEAHAIVADARQPIDLAALRSRRASLVAMTVSDFGTDNPFSDWQATGPVLHALTGELSRSGIRGREPLLPPGDLAYQCAASQAAFALVTALYRALRTGVGDHLDFSALDGAMQALDPGYGISGSATMGKPAHLLSRDRPPKGFQYPILPCADGHVRICLLAKRQWRGMFRWMGEPAAFASPEFDSIAARYKSPDLLPAIAAFCADRTRAELEAEGQRHGVPISAVLTFDEYIASDHVRERAATIDVPAPDGMTVTLPNGAATIDGERMGPISAQSERGGDWPAHQIAGDRPFAGLRVLDLGVIVVGAEQGRLLADQGADVIKVESRAYPDGNRQSHLSYGLSVSFAAGHRNKRSLGIDLRCEAGRGVFLDLAAKADVILSNFKPGTLESLGLGFDTLAAINPGIVMVDSSAFGASGPWSGRMGYGPLVRAATGLTKAWRYPDDPEGFCDSVTIYPDHVAGRIGAMSAVALLIRRLRTGHGGTASIAQSEVMLTHFAADVARLALGQATDTPPDWPWGVYRAAGDDEWCVITVRHQADWEALRRTIGMEKATAHDTVDASLSAWLQERAPDDAVAELQAAGVPAARMLRVADLPAFPYFRARGVFRTETHPYLNEPVIAERWHVKSSAGNEPVARPAPLMGEQTEEVVADWLGLDRGRIDDLVKAGSLEPVDGQTMAAAQAAREGAATSAVSNVEKLAG